MSSDSLGLAPYEEDSSDEEALTDGHLTREKEPEIPAIPLQEDLQTDEQEQLSEPSMVTCFHILTCFLLLSGRTLA